MTLDDIKNMYKDNPKSTEDNLFIPHALLRNKELSINEKFYIAIIYNFHSDKYLLSKWMNEKTFSRPLLLRMKHHLRKIGLSDLLELVSPTRTSAEDAKEFTIKNSHKGYPCEWCGEESFLLHKHHFPVPRKDGGTEIVNICPNCHSTFHMVYKGE